MVVVEDLLIYEAPIRGDTLAEQVYSQLCTAILSGSFAPEERINVRRLAGQINVSVTPAREAVLRLIADGVLQVTEKNAVMVPVRTEAEIQEIFDIRRFLEGGMAEIAAPLLDDDDIRFLKHTQHQFLNALDLADYRQVLRYNSIFHFHIYRRAMLPLRLKIVESLWLRIGPTLRYMYPMLHKNRTDHRRHEDIIEAAEQRHPVKLKDAVLADIASSQTALNQYVREAAEKPRRRGEARRKG